MERSSEIDVRILDWMIGALGDDNSQERFFEAIPGFFNSNLVNLQSVFPERHLETFRVALDGFMGRTLSSKLVSESDKSRRVAICKDITGIIPCPKGYMYTNLTSFFDPLLVVSTEQLQALARWFTHESDNISYLARIGAAKNLARMQDSECDIHWKAVAQNLCCLSPSSANLRRDVALSRNNMILATLIDVSCRAIHSRDWELLGHITQFDINCTLSRLQHGFCELWNNVVVRIWNPHSRHRNGPGSLVVRHPGTGGKTQVQFLVWPDFKQQELLKKQGNKGFIHPLSTFFMGFAIISLLCTKEPIPELGSPLPPKISMKSCSSHRHI